MAHSTQLNTLITEVRTHYRFRQFSRTAIDALCASIAGSHEGEMLNMVGTNPLLRPRIADLVGKFCARDQTPTTDKELSSRKHEISAVFGFAFGYRLANRSRPDAEVRLPGEKNRCLADVIVRLTDLRLEVPLCVQSEIGDAIESEHNIRPDYVAPAEEMGTKAALEHFTSHMRWDRLAKNRNILLVAHVHHIGRCLLLLKRAGLRGYVPRGLPNTYDRLEQQPRVKSDAVYIHSDFVSMISLFTKVATHSP